MLLNIPLCYYIYDMIYVCACGHMQYTSYRYTHNMSMHMAYPLLIHYRLDN